MFFAFSILAIFDQRKEHAAGGIIFFDSRKDFGGGGLMPPQVLVCLNPFLKLGFRSVHANDYSPFIFVVVVNIEHLQIIQHFEIMISNNVDVEL